MLEVQLSELTGNVIDRRLETPPLPDWLDVPSTDNIRGGENSLMLYTEAPMSKMNQPISHSVYQL